MSRFNPSFNAKFAEIDNFKKFNAINPITNSDISNNTVGWVGTSSSLISSINNELIFLATAQNGRYSSPTVPVTTGHKYYFFANVKSTSPLVQVSLSGLEVKYHTGSGNYEYLYGIITAGGTTNYRVTTQDTRTDGWDNVSVKYIGCIDLTVLFGVGNEIPMYQMYLLMSNYPNGWFNGTITDFISHKNMFLYFQKYQTYPVDGEDITEYIQNILNQTNTFVLQRKGIYYINNTIKIPSNSSLKFGSNTRLKMKPSVNKPMFENSDPINGNINISIDGGIFDGSNESNTYEYALLYGIFRFAGITCFTFKNLTLRNPVTFGTQFCRLTNFLIENITYDYNLNNLNMDGVHLHGKCYNGRIINLQGNTNDDLVALNADDQIFRMSNASFATQMENGDMDNIFVDGIYSDNGYRGVRILSISARIDNIKIQNIRGIFNKDTVLMGRIAVDGMSGDGNMGSIELSNISSITKQADKTTIHIDGNCEYLKISDLSIDYSDIVTDSTAVVKVFSGYSVNHLNINNMYLKNTAGNTIVPLVVDGTVGNLIFDNFISDTVQDITVNGTVTNFRSNSFTLE